MAISLDGSGNFIDFGSGLPDIGSGPWSIAMLVNPDAADTASKFIFTALQDASNQGIMFIQAGSGPGRLRAAQGATGAFYSSVTGDTPYTVGKWQVWVATWAGEGDDNFPKIFIDSTTEHASYSSQTDSNNGTGTVNGTTGDITIGALSDASHWDGDMAYLALYDVELDPDEIGGLIKRVHPRLIRPNKLIFGPDLNRSVNDLISGKEGALAGTETIVNHPRLLLPSGNILAPFAAAAVTGNPYYYYASQ